MLTTKLPSCAGIKNTWSYNSTSPYMPPWCGQEQLTLLKFQNIHDQKLQTEVHVKYAHYTFTEHCSFSIFFLAFHHFLFAFFLPFLIFLSELSVHVVVSHPHPPPTFSLDDRNSWIFVLLGILEMNENQEPLKYKCQVRYHLWLANHIASHWNTHCCESLTPSFKKGQTAVSWL